MGVLFNTLQLAGGIILSIGGFPQIVQIAKTKQVRDLSFKMFYIVFVGISLMQVYAASLILKGEGVAFFITNTLALLLQSVLFIQILWYNEKKELWFYKEFLLLIPFAIATIWFDPFSMCQLAGGCLLAFGYIPQILKIIKTKSVRDLSLRSF